MGRGGVWVVRDGSLGDDGVGATTAIPPLPDRRAIYFPVKRAAKYSLIGPKAVFSGNKNNGELLGALFKEQARRSEQFIILLGCEDLWPQEYQLRH